MQYGILQQTFSTYLTQTIEIDFTLQLLWNDSRLQFPPHCYDVDFPRSYNLDPSTSHHFWTPPIELKALLEMRVRDSFRSGQVLIVFQDGYVVSRRKYTAEIACNMDFTYFPFDEQTCLFDLYLGIRVCVPYTLRSMYHSERFSRIKKKGGGG